MLPLNIPKGTRMLIGSPANPMARERSDAIANLVGSIDGITEAHLPHCFAVNVMKEPAQILILSIDPRSDQQSVLDSLGQGLSRIVAPNESLDIWPIDPSEPIMRQVRAANCKIFAKEQKRPWWRPW